MLPMAFMTVFKKGQNNSKKIFCSKLYFQMESKISFNIQCADPSAYDSQFYKHEVQIVGNGRFASFLEA